MHRSEQLSGLQTMVHGDAALQAKQQAYSRQGWPWPRLSLAGALVTGSWWELPVGEKSTVRSLCPVRSPAGGRSPRSAAPQAQRPPHPGSTGRWSPLPSCGVVRQAQGWQSRAGSQPPAAGDEPAPNLKAALRMPGRGVWRWEHVQEACAGHNASVMSGPGLRQAGTDHGQAVEARPGLAISHLSRMYMRGMHERTGRSSTCSR